MFQSDLTRVLHVALLLLTFFFALGQVRTLASAVPANSPAEPEVSGTVMNTSGAMVAGASVTIRNAAGVTKTAVTDASGLFQITGLSLGKYALSVEAKGFAELADEVNISADDPSVLISIVLYPEGRGLPGKITDTSGAAVAGATVRVRNAAGESKSVITDSEGKFQIEGVALDRYSVTVTSKGYAEYMAAGLTAKEGEAVVPLNIVLFPKSPSAVTAAKPEQAPAATTTATAGAPAPAPQPAPTAAEAPQPPPAAAPAPTIAPSAPATVVSVAPPQPGETGITGTVTDTSGALVPGATVTVRTATGESKTTTTDADGKFLVTGLAPGTYEVSVTAPGFAESKIPDVNVTAKEVAALAVRLTLATEATQVNVQAQRGAQVQTETAEVSGTINRNEIMSLGLNGRNFSQLIALAPGVSNQTSQDEAKVGVQGSAKFSVNGGRVEYNTFEVDGVNVLNADIAASHGHTTLILYPSLDAIQEMKVLTSNYGAMFGRSASGTVQVTLKSGKAQFHGVGYEFIRNEDFNSRYFFDPPGRIPLYRRNDFGGAVGGPFYIPGIFNTTKDKTFFFVSEELRYERSPFNFNQAVPSDLERGYNPSTQTYGNTADFSDLCPPLGTSTFSTTQYPDCPGTIGPNGTRSPFRLNQVTIAPAAKAILQTGIIPRANSVGGCNSGAIGIGGLPVNSCYVSTVSPPTHWREDLGRVNHNLGSSTRVFFDAIHDHWITSTATPQWQNGNVVNSFPSVLNDFQGPGLAFTPGVTAIVSPTMVNTFTASYIWQHITLADEPGPGVSLSRAGLDALSTPMGQIFANGYGGKLPGIVIGGTNLAYGGTGMTMDTSYMPWSHTLEKISFRDDLSKVFGKHTVQAGVQYIGADRTELSAANGANSGDVQGLLNFSNVSNVNTTFNAFTDFLESNGGHSVLPTGQYPGYL